MDHECNTTKEALREEKPTLRRWSNCFGLVNRFRRLKNRLSLTQTNTADYATQRPVYPRPSHHHHSATTIATDGPYLSSNETIEHDNRSPTTAYHLSMSNTPTSSLSPPPRHSHHHIGRADYVLHEISEYCQQRECQPTTTYRPSQKMTLRLSLDTEPCDQQHCNNSIPGSPPPDVASMTDSLRMYHGDGGSTLHGESNSSILSNRSSLVPDAPHPHPRSLPPCRSGTLGQYKTIKDETTTTALPPLPSASTSTSSTSLSSIDLPLKERRRRRSPLMFADNDKLTLPIPRNDIITIQYNTNNTTSDRKQRSGGTSSSATSMTTTRILTPNSDDYDAILKSREMTMQQLEGIQKTTHHHGKVVSMARIAPTKLLDEQLVMAMKTDDDDSQRQHATLANQTGSLLTPSATSTAHKPATAVIPPFLPTPSSHHPSPSFYLPSTPNSIDSSYL